MHKNTIYSEYSHIHHRKEGSTQRKVMLDFLINQTEEEVTLISQELGIGFIMTGNWIRLSGDI